MVPTVDVWTKGCVVVVNSSHGETILVGRFGNFNVVVALKSLWARDETTHVTVAD